MSRHKNSAGGDCVLLKSVTRRPAIVRYKVEARGAGKMMARAYTEISADHIATLRS